MRRSPGRRSPRCGPEPPRASLHPGHDANAPAPPPQLEERLLQNQLFGVEVDRNCMMKVLDAPNACAVGGPDCGKVRPAARPPSRGSAREPPAALPVPARTPNAPAVRVPCVAADPAARRSAHPHPPPRHRPLAPPVHPRARRVRPQPAARCRVPRLHGLLHPQGRGLRHVCGRARHVQVRAELARRASRHASPPARRLQAEAARH